MNEATLPGTVGMKAHPSTDTVGSWLRQRRHRRIITLIVLTFVLVGVATLGISMGAVSLSLEQTFAILLERVGISTGVDYTRSQETVLLSIRLPRVLLGVLVGATLSISGAAIQGLFRNPLAEPGLIGTSGGAAMAAVWAIILTKAIAGEVGSDLIRWIVPCAAFLGSLLVTWFVYRLSCSMGRVQVATMLLAGVAITTFSFAVMGLAMFVADDSQLRTITFWTLGSLAGATWQSLLIATPLMLAAVIGLPLLARSMDALALGEAEAFHLGVPVQRVRNMTILLVAMAVGASVALTGIIGFVGLIVPHILRLLIGPDNRTLLPAAALLGAALLAASDLLARTIAEPAEMPLGVVTAFIGAPYFLWILLKNRERGGLF